MGDADGRSGHGIDAVPEAGPERSPVIAASALRQLIDSGNSPVLLDIRWTRSGSRRGDYLDAHLPGARFVDLELELTEPPPDPLDERGRHPLPEPERLQRALRAAGVRADRPVVVYDARDGLAASRAWWLLRWAGHPDVRMLDGGLAAWRDGDGPVESGEPADGQAGQAGDFTVRPGQLPVAGLGEVVAVSEGHADPAGAKGAVLLDARAAERYRGENEPIYPQPGHIPGAVNLPMTDLIDAGGRLLPTTELRQRFSAVLGTSPDSKALDVAGPDGGRPDGSLPIASCGSGITACHTVLAAAAAGYSMAMFPGSYSGWCATGRKVRTGEEP